MTLPRPTRPITSDISMAAQSEIAAPLSQTVHEGTPTQYKPDDVFFYVAQPDINAFELAQLFAVFFNGIMLHHEIFEKLPKNLKRHFIHKKTI